MDRAEADRSAVARLRDRVVGQHDDLAYLERIDFFLERADLPESDAAAEWDAYVTYGADVDARVERLSRPHWTDSTRRSHRCRLARRLRGSKRIRGHHGPVRHAHVFNP